MVDKKQINTKTSSIQLKICGDSQISSLLRKYRCQTFTSTITNPKSSFFDDMKKKLQISNILQEVTTKDLEKFSDSQANSVATSPIIPKRGCNPIKISLDIRGGLNGNYTDYIKRITNPYISFKSNHSNTKYIGKAVCLSLQETSKIQKKSSEISDMSTSSSFHYNYDPLSDNVIKAVGAEFFNESYSLSSEYLNLKFNDLSKVNMMLMEKNGVVEKEITKVLSHSNLLYNFILDNNFVSYDMASSIDTLSFMKVKLAKTKHFFIDCGLKQIYLNHKKNKLTKLSRLGQDLKTVHSLLAEVEALLDKDHKNTKELQNILLTANTKLTELHEDQCINIRKQLSDYPILNILTCKIEALRSKMNSNALNEVLSGITSMFEQENYAFSHQTQEAIEGMNSENSTSKVISNLENNVKFILSEEQRKSVTSILNTIKLKDASITRIKKDHQSKVSLLFSKLTWTSLDQSIQGLATIFSHLIKLLGERLKSLKVELNTLIHSKLKETDIQEKLIGDSILISIMTTDMLAFYYMNKMISEEILLLQWPNFKLTKDKIDDYMNRFLSTMASGISNSIENCLACFVNTLAIESFTRSCDVLNNSAGPFYNEIGSDMGFTVSKPHTDFIFQFFEDKNSKMIESIECDDFSNLKIVSPYYQAIVDFIEERSFKILKESGKDMLIIELEKLSLVTSQNEANAKGMIKIKSKQFKCCCSTLEVIKFVLEIIKLFLLFDELYQDQIYMLFVKLLTSIINFSKELILDGKGCEKGNFKAISQNLILMLASNLSFLKNLIQALLEKLKEVSSSELLHSLFADLVKKVEGYIVLARNRIYAMYSKKVQESLDEVKAINFTNYEVLENSVSNYTLVVLVTLPKIYESAESCFDSENTEFIIVELLTIYFEGLDEMLPSKPKFDNEEKAKQFKKDMINLKKSVAKNFPLIELSWVRSKTDGYTKLLIPEHLIKSKK